MERTKISLKALEVFLSVARKGALSEAAGALGISVSTASHHLSELEKTAGVALFDHGRRPLRLTPAGEVLSRRVDEALGSLRKGFSEIWSDDLQSMVRRLRIALIEDFDADVGPVLAEHLIRAAPQSEISFLSRPTHDIHDQLLSDQVDIGVATSSDFDGSGIIERPLLRDPFILVLPANAPATQGLNLAEIPDALPFLRYSRRQVLGRRIEAQLRRMDLHFRRRMEFEATHIILSLVAASRGWTITTVLTFARAQRYHSQLRVLPFPGSAFTREISAFVREDVPNPVAQLSINALRNAVQRMVIDPTCARYPWLSEQFHLLPTPDPAVTAPKVNKSETAP